MLPDVRPTRKDKDRHSYTESPAASASVGGSTERTSRRQKYTVVGEGEGEGGVVSCSRQASQSQRLACLPASDDWRKSGLARCCFEASGGLIL